MFQLKVIKSLLKSETINNIIFTKSSTDLKIMHIYNSVRAHGCFPIQENQNILNLRTRIILKIAIRSDSFECTTIPYISKYFLISKQSHQTTKQATQQ